MKYIDAEKLIAEIERLAETLPEVRSTMEGLLSFIASLQQEQPEVDFEKELRNYNVPFNDNNWERLCHNTLKEIARHFYELGLNARKEGAK